MFNITLDNVDLGYAQNSNSAEPLFRIIHNNRQKGGGTVNFKFNNCDFDFATNAPSGKIQKIFNFSDPANIVNVNAEVIGGSFRFYTFDSSILMLNLLDIGNDSVVYSKEDGGNYACLILKKGISAPTEEFTLSNGKAVFVKISDDGETAIYRLKPVEVANIDFVPKMSLTLDENLILNIYIPNVNFLVDFTLDGKVYSEYDIKNVFLQGEIYYLISVPLPASEGARDVVLSVNIEVEDKIANGTFTFSIPKYASKVLSGGTDVEKQLVSDILSYIKAAYNYFKPGTEETVSVINTINALIGEDYDETASHTPEGSIETPEGLKAATFSLDSTPALKFYLPDGADASKYSFKINGRTVEFVIDSDSYGTYAKIDLYAYQMCENITYYVGGIESGSYHIASYHAWAETQNNKALVNLVERFWKYAQSARDYKNSVTG